MSGRRLIAIVVIVAALAAIAVVNYVYNMDPTQLAARGVGRDAHSHDEPEEQPEEPVQDDQAALKALLEPIGPSDAPVKIQAVYADPGAVEKEYRPLMVALSQEYGDLLRMEFVDSTNEANRARLAALSPTFRAGLIIDGKITMDVPGTTWGVVSFIGAPTLDDWSVSDLRLAVENALREKGVSFESHVGDGPPGAPAQEGPPPAQS